MNSEIYKIHNINSALNRFFGPLIYIFATIVVLLLVLLPYRGRLLLALIINIFFNRPTVYINFIAQKISFPLQKINVFFLYSFLFSLFAPLYRIFIKSENKGFQQVDKDYNTDQTNSRFQS